MTFYSGWSIISKKISRFLKKYIRGHLFRSLFLVDVHGSKKGSAK